MKLLAITGSHPRHAFMVKELINYFDQTLLIEMKREDLIPEHENISNFELKNIFTEHFEARYKIEKKNLVIMKLKHILI